MLSLNVAYLLIGMHFFADFVFQLPKVGSARGTIPRTLITHCIFYAIPFAIFGAQFFVGMLCCHWLTDYFTDKLLKKYWLEKRARRHRLVFGFDQSFHIFTVFVVYGIVGIDYSVYNMFIGLLGV